MTKDLSTEQQATLLSIVSKLRGLNLAATFAGIEDGPVVAAYYFIPGPSTQISKIISRSEDLALATGKDNIYVQRSGGFVVIFIPKPERERKVVDFKENLYWYLHNESVSRMDIPIPVGITPMGEKSAFDLASSPHVLISGSTGSGKSVFEAQLISSLSYYFKPNDLHIYLVDTKKVDLPLFSSLPHVVRVASTVDEFHKIADSIMRETRKRLLELANASVRNIKEYRKLGLDMPYIVVILDEFADLADQDEGLRKAARQREKDDDIPNPYKGTPTVREWLNQITRIARAAGVHIIACTQRSSVEVIDGDTKTNFPVRIALRLPTAIDSRTILGQSGAEKLLGKGDMLVHFEDKTERFHGPYVSMGDITELVTTYDFMSEVFKRS